METRKQVGMEVDEVQEGSEAKRTSLGAIVMRPCEANAPFQSQEQIE